MGQQTRTARKQEPIMKPTAEHHSTTIKVSLGQDMRRFTISEPLRVLQLREHCVGLFGIPDASFKLLWVDEDGDRISIVHEDDLKEAFCAVCQSNTTLRLELASVTTHGY